MVSIAVSMEKYYPENWTKNRFPNGKAEGIQAKELHRKIAEERAIFRCLFLLFISLEKQPADQYSEIIICHAAVLM